MKPVLCLLFALGACGAAWADVQIEYKGVTGATSTMFSNGHKVRINRDQIPGYVLFDGETEEFFIVDTRTGEVIKTTYHEIPGVAPDEKLNVSLKTRGSGGKIAGYSTGRFDLISSGLYCGTLNGSSKLIENPEMKSMLQAMQSMHKLSGMRMAKAAGELSECQQASSQMTNLIGESGFVVRYIDDQGKLIFEVLSVKFDEKVETNYYQVPPGMKVVDMNQQVDPAAQ